MIFDKNIKNKDLYSENNSDIINFRKIIIFILHKHINILRIENLTKTQVKKKNHIFLSFQKLQIYFIRLLIFSKNPN